MSTERTEKASPQKKKKAAEQGDKLISRELISAAAMLCAVLSIRRCCSDWVVAWMQSYRSSTVLMVAANHSALSAENVARACRTIAIHCLLAMLTFYVATCGGALLMGLIQSGGSLTAATIIPRLSRINPAAHVKSLFGIQAVIRLAKSFIPALIIVSIAGAKVRELQLKPMSDLHPIYHLCLDVYDLLLSTAFVMLLWSLIDYFSSWRSREGRLKMSKQDVRDESKQSEGSPQIKMKIRSLQRQMRKRQLRVDVSKATVVLTNPTHYAVALKFDFIQMDPPKVLAKGRNLVARQIREDAQWAGVPIVANPALARSLFRGVEVGQSIPFDLYAAVAGILAYLYRKEMDEKRRAYDSAAIDVGARTRNRESVGSHPRQS